MNKVLIIERKPQVRDSLQSVFAKKGIVSCAESDECDVREGEFLHPDLIILGLSDSLDESLEVVKRLRKQFKGVPTFILLDEYDYAAEKKLLLLGITATFSRFDDHGSILANAQAVLTMKFG